MRSFNLSSEILNLLNTKEYKSLGIVPTMGSLHNGHVKLIEKCSTECDETIVSIFVNPTQFNNKIDLINYPKSVKKDIEIIKKINSNAIIYTPFESDLYPSPVRADIFDLDGIDKIIEGKFRKGHFQGVATVVKKLFEKFSPDYAYFGEKDYQQIQIIKALNKSLKLGVKIISCSTEREKDGLAISTRNKFLNPRQRSAAQKIYFALTELKNAKKKFLDMKRFFINTVEHSKDLKVEYFCIASIDDLIPVVKFQKLKKYRIFVAVFAGETRLIDNEEIKIFN